MSVQKHFENIVHEVMVQWRVYGLLFPEDLEWVESYHKQNYSKNIFILKFEFKIENILLNKNTFNIGSLSSLHPCLVQNHEKQGDF